MINGTQEEVECAVKDAIRTLRPGGRFIISPTNTHPVMNLKQINWMLEATKKYGQYPLNL
ncbi:MAG: hypothetical protein GF311_11105 [Candidatus Lokiarchaeota archaeon]|nr:hypothetical protein [Candidatus Lokiarchaeota archaeon]